MKFLLAVFVALVTSTLTGSLLTALYLTWNISGGVIEFVGIFMAVAVWAFLYLVVLSVVFSYPIWIVLRRVDNVASFSLLGFYSGLILYPFINYTIYLVRDFQLTVQSLVSGDGLLSLLFHAVVGGVFGFIYASSLAGAYGSFMRGEEMDCAELNTTVHDKGPYGPGPE